MDKVRLQDIVDELMPGIRKTMISEVQQEMARIGNPGMTTSEELSCALEAIADTVLKAAAELFVESMDKILNPTPLDTTETAE
jgi:hypothetical protein